MVERASSQAGEAADDLSLRATLPRTTGLTLVANAIADGYLLMDAPHCVYRRLAYLQGNHDLESTLALFPGLPRVTNTGLSPHKVIYNRDAELERQLTALVMHPGVGVVLMDAMAMAVITGSDYGRICSNVREKTGRLAVQVPHRSLSSDYLTAYAEAMEALAKHLPLAARGNETPRRAALLGLMWDRNEGDHRGNLAELQRIFAALDLELVSTWFSGGPTSDLIRAQEADLVVSLPYGRRAARTLARRIGQPLVQAQLPFGVTSTLRFVLTVGAAAGRLEQAVAFVERELGEVLPRLKWLAPFALLHRRLGFVGDPHLLRGMRELAALVGCRLRFAATTNLPVHARESEPVRPDPLDELALPEDVRTLATLAPSTPELVLAYPHAKQLETTLSGLEQEHALDLLVTNSFGFLASNLASVELGFPSYHTHFLADQPFLGLRGALSVLERMANASRAHEVRGARAQWKKRGEP